MKFFIHTLIFFNVLLVAVSASDLNTLAKALLSRVWSSGSNVDVLDCFDRKMHWDWTVDEEFRKSLDKQNFEVYYHLASREKPQKVKSAIGNVGTVSNFKITKPTVIIVHGFRSHGDETWITEMKEAFLKYGDVNVIIADWKEGSKMINYLTAAENIRHVAYKLTNFIAGIVNDKILHKVPVDVNSWGPIHCVGHSLGAHVCGLVAKMVKIHPDIPEIWELKRISGLDPAHPCFEHPDILIKLKKDDAPFVDIIHTNMQLRNKMGFGLPDEIGHMDFFPNGGHVQPGCGTTKRSFWDFAWDPVRQLNEAICSHGRAYVYFTESVALNDKIKYIFPSTRWNRTLEHAEQILNDKPCIPDESVDCAEMGIDSIRYKAIGGTFFTYTGPDPPYSDVDHKDKSLVKYLLAKIGSFFF